MHSPTWSKGHTSQLLPPRQSLPSFSQIKTASKHHISKNQSKGMPIDESGQSGLSGKLSSSSSESECPSVQIDLVEKIQVPIKVSSINGIEVAVKTGISPQKKAQQLGFVPMLEGLKQKIQRQESRRANNLE